MKIAIVCSYDFSIAWSLEIFIKKLLKQNHVITVISDVHDGHTENFYLDTITKWGVNHEFLKTYRFFSPYEDIKYLYGIYKHLTKNNYDMVINIATKPNIYGSIAAKLAGIKNIICFAWGLGLTFEKSNSLGRIFLRYALLFLYFIAFKISKKIWFTNKNDLEYFLRKKILSEGKSFLSNGFVDTESFSPSIITTKVKDDYRNKLGFDSNDKVIILVARMSWAKGIKQFCEASDILRKKNPEAKFLLIGQDDKGSPDAVPEQYIKKYASHNNFLHLGYRVDIKELYSISYMAVFPSYYREGGWPRGLTEPMSMGKPVITTDNIHASGAVIHGKNGFIVPMKDSYELANSIKILLDDSALASKFGQESRKLAIKNLDEKKIMSDLIQAII